MIIVILLLLHWTLTPGASGKIRVSLSPRRKESGMSYKENLTLSEKKWDGENYYFSKRM